MEIEKKIIKVLLKDNTILHTEVILNEELPDDEKNVFLQMVIKNRTFRYTRENFFCALQDLRKDLEEKDIQILCNGAAQNVYPSPMQVDMGSGRVAYALEIGKHAKLINVVDIFDCNEKFLFVTIKEQEEFYNKWIRSVEDKDLSISNRIKEWICTFAKFL